MAGPSASTAPQTARPSLAMLHPSSFGLFARGDRSVHAPPVTGS
jgi:hypothetical protein